MMNRAPDRKRLRREYLLKKGGVYLRAFLGFALSLALVTFVFHMVDSKMFRLGSWRGGGTILIMILYVRIVIKKFRKAEKNAQKIAATIPYVPPVRLDTLPANEVLVRGAEEPTAAGDTLLRAAAGSRSSLEQEGGVLVRGAEDPTASNDIRSCAAIVSGSAQEEEPQQVLLQERDALS